MARQVKKRLTERYNAELSETFESYRLMGYTLRETAEELDVKYTTLKTWAWEAGVKFKEHRDHEDFLPKRVKYKGKEYTIAELARLNGMSRRTLSGRLRNGWSIEAAVETPVRNRTEMAQAKGKDKSRDGLDTGRLWLRGKL